MDVRFCARQEPLPRGIRLQRYESCKHVPGGALASAPQEDHCLLLTKTYMEVGISDKWSGKLPSSRATLRSPSPLRTVHDTFASHGSSIQ